MCSNFSKTYLIISFVKVEKHFFMGVGCFLTCESYELDTTLLSLFGSNLKEERVINFHKIIRILTLVALTAAFMLIILQLDHYIF